MVRGQPSGLAAAHRRRFIRKEQQQQQPPQICHHGRPHLALEHLDSGTVSAALVSTALGSLCIRHTGPSSATQRFRHPHHLLGERTISQPAACTTAAEPSVPPPPPPHRVTPPAASGVQRSEFLEGAYKATTSARENPPATTDRCSKLCIAANGCS